MRHEDLVEARPSKGEPLVVATPAGAGAGEIPDYARTVLTSYYYYGPALARVAQHRVAGRLVVDQYDPDTWPYPPETDCIEEWNAPDE